MQCRLSAICWRAIDPAANAIELVKCWVVDRVAGPFPETATDRAIQKRGDWRFAGDPDQHLDADPLMG
jgi:hypothetical protein